MLVRYQLRQQPAAQVIERLRSVQFDPLAPVGCNHDLVLQARDPDYRIGQWSELAYARREIYDGWDKQASLVAFSGWPLRRALHKWHAALFERIFLHHADAVQVVLQELADRGPMTPRDFEFQQNKPEWRGTWFGPSLTKQVLRALWHTGKVMTHSRRTGQHVYDLAERIVPQCLLEAPEMGEHESGKQIILDRHKGAGIMRRAAPYEVWAMWPKWYDKDRVLRELSEEGMIVPVEIEGVKANAHRDLLEETSSATASPAGDEPLVSFIAPLDQIVWDRKLVAHLFGFEYLWEVYVPEAKRRWGYYVLPVLYGDRFVARAEFWSRGGSLEARAWHWENGGLPADFWPALEKALARFARYAGADKMLWPTGSGADLRAASKRALAS